jgi:tetratricopeptide (TPR) repeat protein
MQRFPAAAGTRRRPGRCLIDKLTGAGFRWTPGGFRDSYSLTSAAEPVGTVDVALAHASRLLQVRPDLAVEQAGEILKAIPGHPQATLICGVGRRLAGDPQGALAVLEPLSAAHPNWPTAHYERALSLISAGRCGVAALRRALALQPDLPDAWRVLADQLTLHGDLEGADLAYNRHVTASTRDPRLMNAALALTENQIPQAELLLREHLKKFPTDVAAIRMFAEVAGRLRRYEDAENLLARALELAPGFNAARYNYAMALYRLNKFAAALAQIEILTEREPRNSGYRNLKAVVLASIGEYGQALALYADVLSKHPEQARIWMSYGHALASVGRQEESIAAYRRCIELLPTLGEAYYSLANLKTFRFEPEDVGNMRARLASADLANEDRAHFHFALGKALEDARSYAESFEHYAQGNKLRAARAGYDPDSTTAFVARASRLFTPEFFAGRAGYGATAADPIFIVGLPRAGSTLIEQILASHSLVEGTMELPNIMAMAAELGGKPGRWQDSAYPDSLARLTAEQCRALGERYLADTRIQRKTGKPYFIDKLPNNFLHLGLIRLALPNAKVIDARRHPMACCFSGFKQSFASGQRFSYDLTHIGLYYRDYVRLMAQYDAVLPGWVHRVLHEDLIEDTESVVRRLLEFCGLPFEAGTLNFHENDRPVRTASAQQVRQPINRSGVDQWRHYEPWLGPLRESLGEVLTRYPHSPRY